MPKNSFLKALFSGPKFSLAPIEAGSKGSTKIGRIVPVFADVLNQREGVELNMSHLVRFLPAKAPVMEGYKVTFDAFVVPYSCLGYAERKERDIDDFFNLHDNDGTQVNPFCFPMSRMFTDDANGLHFIVGDKRLGRFGLSEAFRLGNIPDYLNFPSLKGVRDHVRKWLAVNPFAYGSNFQSYYDSNSNFPFDSSGYSIASFVGLAYLNDSLVGSQSDFVITIDLSGRGHGIGVFHVGVPFCTSDNPLLVKSDNDEYANSAREMFYTYPADNTFGMYGFEGAYSLLGYILRNYPAVASYYGFNSFSTSSSILSDITNMANHIAYLMDEDNPISLDYLQVLYDNYQVDAQSIYSEYFNYIMGLVLYNSNLKNGDEYRLWTNDYGTDRTFLPMLNPDEPIDMSFLAAYWKIISDWYINTNIDGDPDAFYLSHCRLLDGFDGSDDDTPDLYVDVKPFYRRWGNDIFTSAVPMAEVDNIRIPADGTIPDLRDANAMQRLKDILRNTGSRLADVVFGIRGIRPSAVRSEMSEPIATRSSWVGLQSVLQTSGTTPSSPQAAYAGVGTDSSGFDRFFKYVNNDEPTPVIVMVLMSITQRPTYMQGFDRKFFRKSIYDFAIPQLAMVGEQEVTNKELYFDKDYAPGTFGFNRRYYDWFDSKSSVHGELRDSLDYWHGARVFDSQPALNSEFIGIDPDLDHLQRIFANTSESSSPIIFNVSFDGYFTRALPRYIQYEL